VSQTSHSHETVPVLRAEPQELRFDIPRGDMLTEGRKRIVKEVARDLGQLFLECNRNKTAVLLV
jgi:hypothetical protein